MEDFCIRICDQAQIILRRLCSGVVKVLKVYPATKVSTFVGRGSAGQMNMDESNWQFSEHYRENPPFRVSNNDNWSGGTFFDTMKNTKII